MEATYLEDDYNINVQILDFGNSIPAVVTINDDGSFSIFLNARLTYEKRLEAYWHEIRHIQNQDFYSEMSVDELETVNEHWKNFSDHFCELTKVITLSDSDKQTYKNDRPQRTVKNLMLYPQKNMAKI